MSDQAGPSTAPPPRAPPSPAEPSTPESVPGFDSWRRSLAQFTGMGMTDQDRILRDKEEERRKLERDWEKCEKWKKGMMTRSECGALGGGGEGG